MYWFGYYVVIYNKKINFIQSIQDSFAIIKFMNNMY